MTNWHAENGFRTTATVAALLSIVGLAGGCSTPPFEHDAMCPEIARFANSSNDDAVHSVELITDWVRSSAKKGVHCDVIVSVEFATGSNEHPPSLKISAQRYRS